MAGCKNTIIPEGVTTIAQYAMQGFSDLTSIVIPSTVTEIKANAFLNCSNLETVEIKALTPPTLGTTPFKGTSASKKLYVEPGYLNAYWANDAFVTAFGMENITIAPSDTKIWDIVLAGDTWPDVTMIRKYNILGGNHEIPISISQPFSRYFFDANDIANTESITIKVAQPTDGSTVIVKCNGESMIPSSDSPEGYLCFMASPRDEDRTWTITNYAPNKYHVTAVGENGAMVALKTIDAVGNENVLGGCPNFCRYTDIAQSLGVKFYVTPVEGDQLQYVMVGDTKIMPDDERMEVLPDGIYCLTLQPGSDLIPLNRTLTICAFTSSAEGQTNKYDVNGDGRVNIVDVTELVNKILGN